MTSSAAYEPTIDTSLMHYMEERALTLALAKANTVEELAVVHLLTDLRTGLMHSRASFNAEATAKRHARGEFYSTARVAAINGIGPTKSDLDQNVKVLYSRRSRCKDVLKVHARAHFGYALMSSRLLLDAHTQDVIDAAREMQQREEAFAAAWVAAIGDQAFTIEIKQTQREAFRQLRTSKRPMHFVTSPESRYSDVDATVLGKAWNKLDEMAVSLGVEPLSAFIALPDEDVSAGQPASRLLSCVDSLLENLQAPSFKMPGKRATIEALTQIRDMTRELGVNGRVSFEVDI